MGYEVKMLAFSQNEDGQKMATFLTNPPRSIQAEILRHRMLSFSAASSRAIPTKVMIQRLLDDPYVPQWTKNSKGMSGEFVHQDDIKYYNEEWEEAKLNAITQVLRLITGKRWDSQYVKILTAEEITQEIELVKNFPHKGDINRLLEPFMFMELIVSGTEWANFFFQRVHKAAHPAFQRIAYEMAKLYFTETPKQLQWGEWHLPLVTTEDRNIIGESVGSYDISAQQGYTYLAKLSTARCGRVSYSKQDKKDIESDLRWYEDHIEKNTIIGEPPHVSPAEHPAQAYFGWNANLNGFKAFRKTITNEYRASYSLEDLNQYEGQTGKEITK